MGFKCSCGKEFGSEWQLKNHIVGKYKFTGELHEPEDEEVKRKLEPIIKVQVSDVKTGSIKHQTSEGSDVQTQDQEKWITIEEAMKEAEKVDTIRLLFLAKEKGFKEIRLSDGELR